MKRFACIPMLGLAAGLWGLDSAPAARAVAPVDEARYAWQFPVVRDVTGADALVTELRHEVQRVLDAGHLAPLYVSTSDQESVGYMIYQEPGRLVTTLAWAYPHLTPAQQEAVRAYVNAEFADARFSPWGRTAYGKNGDTNFPLPRDAGSPREDHPKDRWWYARADFGLGRPFLHPLYGVWLYGWRTGDWTAVRTNWSAIVARYERYAGTAETRLYGGMGTHLAVARLAQQLGDAPVREAALGRLRTALTAGLDFDAVELLARGAPGKEWQSPYGSYPNLYDARTDGTSYKGWLFLNLTPEIGRYLDEADATLRANVLARHAVGTRTFPLWWMPKANYFTRSWTGDEGSGLVSEVMGMMAPLERWVVHAPAATLARQMRGAPWGRGDCHWLEALVQAIEAHGTLAWRDVRYPGVALETWRQAVFGAEAALPRARLTADGDGDGIVNLAERALGLDPRSPDGGTGVQVVTTAEGYLALTYTEVKEAWDLDYRVETSGDGFTWQSGAGFTVPVERAEAGDRERVTVRDAIPTGPAAPRHIRLRVRGGGEEVTVFTTAPPALALQIEAVAEGAGWRLRLAGRPAGPITLLTAPALAGEWVVAGELTLDARGEAVQSLAPDAGGTRFYQARMP